MRKEITLIILLLLSIYLPAQVSISVDKTTTNKENFLLLIKCKTTSTIVFCQEGQEKSRKEFKGDKYFEVSNKYELIQILDDEDINTTYINLTNKEGLLKNSELLRDKKEKEVIYL